ncbi:DUF3613 domain-containing protein [Comamonas sp. 4034]|uniref:DUF3613 domain-containing protein n=1 Tax=Comamonas sp. 4034 TaxID=3156455 RepID=UPI003D1B4E3B
MPAQYRPSQRRLLSNVCLSAATAMWLSLTTIGVQAQTGTLPPSSPSLEAIELTEQAASARNTSRTRESSVALSSGYQYRSDVGYATDSLLDMQRNALGERARNIDAEQARRSYERYLKSFETEIPEQFDTGLGVKKR